MTDIYKTQRLYQVESGPFSETFEIVGPVEPLGTFSGIFDLAHTESSMDNGHVSRKTVATHIMVATIPTELVGKERTATIRRVSTDTTYKYNKAGEDIEGVPLLWLV